MYQSLLYDSCIFSHISFVFQVANNPVYSGTFEILEKVLTKFGVEVTWVTSGCPVDEYKKNVKQNTKVT